MAHRSVLIIGAGVAGLTAGSYLARKGFHVKVLEANSKIGGCCGSTEINGFTFNDGAQYLIYPKLLDLVFSQLGFSRAEILPLRRVTAPATTHLPNGISVSIGENFSIAVENGALDIPRAQHELQETLKKWAPVGDIITGEEIMLNPFSVGRLLSRIWRHLPKLGRSLEEELKALFKDPNFRSAIASQLLYAGVPLSQLPSVSIVALIGVLRGEIALPIGGMGRIPEALAHTLTQHGGEILINARIKKICIANGRVHGVITESHGFIAGDLVISTVNAMATYQFLLDEKDQPRRLANKAKRTPLSATTFCIQLGLSNKLDAKSHIHYISPMMEELKQYFHPARDKADWGYYSIPTIIAPELAPASGSIVEFAPVTQQRETLQSWSNERKHRLTNEAIEWLRTRMDMNIVVNRIRSPREFESQLNLYRGAIYGVSAAKGLTGLFPHKTPITGLYLAGQTTFPGLGVPTAALSGIHASNILLRDYHLT